jgi:hypothetical protein
MLYCVNFHLIGTRRKGDLSHHNSKNGGNIDIGPGNLKLSFSSTSGKLERMYNSKTGVRNFSCTYTSGECSQLCVDRIREKIT